MKIFQPMFEKAMLWSRHKYAPYYLGGLSFAESCVLPFPPPDVMLAPMSMANPQRAWFFAMLTTILSVLGGLLGYLIGVLFFSALEPWLHEYGYWDRYQLAVQMFNEYGPWAIFIAGFSPIPYKIFTISAGVLNMALLPFVIASIVGRGARFYLVAALMRWGGEKMEHKLKQYIDRLGWAVVGVFCVAILVYKVFYAG
jgi:membrane protein YqaA with SNARE-associated domain